MKSSKWLSLNYFLQYAVQGVFFQFWMVYLTNVKGLTIFEASAVFSMSYLSRFISGIFISNKIIYKFGFDMSYKIISCSGFLVSLLYMFSDTKYMLLCVTFLFGLTYFSLTPLTETTSSIFLEEENIDYGKVRVFGSVSFMVSGIILGGLIGYISQSYIYYALLFFVFIYMCFTFLPSPKLLKLINLDGNVKKNKYKSYSWMKNDFNAILLIATYFFLQISHAAYNNYSVLYLESLNISMKWLTGFIVNISVISEILFFMFSKKFIKNISPHKLLIFACLVASFRWLILGIFKNVYVLILIQPLHAITFALAQLSFILLLNKYFSKEKTLDMQNLYSAIGFQLSAFLGMYIVGFIWDISTSLVFYVSSLIAFVAFLISLKLKFNEK